MDYPRQWDDLPKRDRKKKLKELKREKEEQKVKAGKLKNAVIWGVVLIGVFVGYKALTKKTPEEAAFEQALESTSLEGRVEDFEILGASHIAPGVETTYNTNPPTSGSHWAQSASWGFYDKELPDAQVVHNLEHGGIWISYKDLGEDEVDKLKSVAKSNSGSAIVTSRPANDDKIAVVSWGKMMRLDSVDEALIQKFIDTNKNQSPEKFAK